VILDAFGDEVSIAISDPERFLLLPLFCGDAAVLSDEELDFDLAGLEDDFFNSSTSTASSARYVSGRKEMQECDTRITSLCQRIRGIKFPVVEWSQICVC
jgi:hypothetical protein